MSLINDALKRAKQAQKNNPPPASTLPLRPAEPPARRANSSDLRVAMIVGIVVALTLFIFWQSSQKNPQAVPQAVAPANNSPATPPVAPAAPVIAKADPAPAPAVAATVVGTSATNEAPVAVAAASVAPAKPAAPKLQAIFFNPRRPSAMVNGKSVLVGGRVGEFRVAAIEPASVTLTSATSTNVLTLEVE